MRFRPSQGWATWLLNFLLCLFLLVGHPPAAVAVAIVAVAGIVASKLRFLDPLQKLKLWLRIAIVVPLIGVGFAFMDFVQGIIPSLLLFVLVYDLSLASEPAPSTAEENAS